MGKTFKATVDWLGMVENGGNLPGQDEDPSVSGGKAQIGKELISRLNPYNYTRTKSGSNPLSAFLSGNYEMMPEYDGDDKDEAFTKARDELGEGQMFLHKGVRYKTDYAGETTDDGSDEFFKSMEYAVKNKTMEQDVLDRFKEIWIELGQPSLNIGTDKYDNMFSGSSWDGLGGKDGDHVNPFTDKLWVGLHKTGNANMHMSAVINELTHVKQQRDMGRVDYLGGYVKDMFSTGFDQKALYDKHNTLENDAHRKDNSINDVLTDYIYNGVRASDKTSDTELPNKQKGGGTELSMCSNGEWNGGSVKTACGNRNSAHNLYGSTGITIGDISDKSLSGSLRGGLGYSTHVPYSPMTGHVGLSAGTRFTGDEESIMFNPTFDATGSVGIEGEFGGNSHNWREPWKYGAGIYGKQDLVNGTGTTAGLYGNVGNFSGKVGYNTNTGAEATIGFGLPIRKDGEEIIQGGLLPEVEVSALTDKTYNTLSNPQKQVYNTFINPNGDIAQTVNIGKHSNTTWNDYETEMNRIMHWKGALQMTDDVGVKNISNKPYESMFGSISYPIRNEKGDFRAHAKMGDREIHIPPYDVTNSPYGWTDNHMKNRREDGVGIWDFEKTLGGSNLTPEQQESIIQQFNNSPSAEKDLELYEKTFRDINIGEGREAYFSDLIAEYAHLPEYDNKSLLNRPLTSLKRAYRGIKEGKKPNNSNYTDPHDFEYKTHTGPNSYEEKLRSKYELQEGGERERFINFLKDNEGGAEYIRNKNSVTKKIVDDEEWDGESYHKIFDEDSQMHYAHIVGDEKSGTIGYGHHNKDVLKNYPNGITETKALEMLGEDADAALSNTEIWWNSKYKSGDWEKLDESTQYMLADIGYNVGHIREFPKFANAINTGDFELAEAQYKRYDNNIELGRNATFMEEYLKPWMDVQKEKIAVPPSFDDMPLPIGVNPIDGTLDTSDPFEKLDDLEEFKDGGSLRKFQGDVGGSETKSKATVFIGNGKQGMFEANFERMKADLDKKYGVDNYQVVRAKDVQGMMNSDILGEEELLDFDEDNYTKALHTRRDKSFELFKKKNPNHDLNKFETYEDLEADHLLRVSKIKRDGTDSYSTGDLHKVLPLYQYQDEHGFETYNDDKEWAAADDNVYSLSNKRKAYLKQNKLYKDLDANERLNYYKTYFENMGEGSDVYMLKHGDNMFLSKAGTLSEGTRSDFKYGNTPDKIDTFAEAMTTWGPATTGTCYMGVCNGLPGAKHIANETGMTTKAQKGNWAGYYDRSGTYGVDQTFDEKFFNPQNKGNKQSGGYYNTYTNKDGVNSVESTGYMAPVNNIQKYGGQHNWALDRRPISNAQRGKEIKSDDVYSNDRYSSNASKYKTMLPKYQSEGAWNDFEKSSVGKFVNAKGLRQDGEHFMNTVGDYFGYDEDEGKDLALDATAIINPAADFIHAGTKFDEGEYTDAALYAGLGILPFSAGPLVKGVKNKIINPIKNAFKSAPAPRGSSLNKFKQIKTSFDDLLDAPKTPTQTKLPKYNSDGVLNVPNIHTTTRNGTLPLRNGQLDMTITGEGTQDFMVQVNKLGDTESGMQLMTRLDVPNAYYLDMSMTNQMDAGQTMKYLEEFMPKGSTISSKTSLSMDSYKLMLNRVKRGKFSIVPNQIGSSGVDVLPMMDLNMMAKQSSAITSNNGGWVSRVDAAQMTEEVNKMLKEAGVTKKAKAVRMAPDGELSWKVIIPNLTLKIEYQKGGEK